MPLLNPYFSTRRWLNLSLVVGGALAGGAFGIVLTRAGKIIADAPPATIGNYLWNAAVFGLLAAVFSPIISWNWLRRVPLWRTLVEPLAYAAAGSAAAVLIGIPVLILLLPPAGLIAGFVLLHRRYPGSYALPDAPPILNVGAMSRQSSLRTPTSQEERHADASMTDS